LAYQRDAKEQENFEQEHHLRDPFCSKAKIILSPILPFSATHSTYFPPPGKFDAGKKAEFQGN
jgi:hypothetical protein